MSATLVMQEEKRSETSRKTPLRLPIIAPKDDYSSSANSSRSGHQSTGPSIPPRARLPPRSRTGCWTCRTRKVKCDEGRPVCGQCTRLGHSCDYSPRLSFRDDTPRVVERMQEVSVVGSSIWDCRYPPQYNGLAEDGTVSPVTTDASIGSAGADDLPPFATLVTDEERERKAEMSSPGTYHVVVNPDSFQHMPEYSDDPEIKKERLSPLRRGSLAASLTSSLGRESILIEGSASGDQNTVVLPRFEDVARRGTSNSKDKTSPPSPITARIKLEEREEMGPPRSPDRSVREDNYMKQFRTVVWKQLVPAEIDHLDGMERSSVMILEHEAAYFPPLFHAMLAVAALSMASQDGKERLDALQHYQKALPALQSTLKSPEDISSDGAFLTHYLLLVYEIAAAEAGLSNLWSQHLSTLLRISLLRREVFGGERYPFIVWWICMIDLDALFSGTGSGEYVGTMLKNDIVPPPSFHLYPLGMDGSSVVYAQELETLPTILQLDYEVTVLAVRLALLSHEFRQDTKYGNNGSQQCDRDTRLRQSRIFEIQESLRQLWVAPGLMMIGQNVDMLPIRSKRLFEHASTLYRACIIYSHTSMWSTQRLETSPDYDMEIAVASNQLLQMTSRMLADGRADCRFLVFPVFMAGFASSDGGQKRTALELIGMMEKVSIGRNTAASRIALGTVYDKQNERFMTTGQSQDVDWMDVISEQGMAIVNFGL